MSAPGRLQPWTDWQHTTGADTWKHHRKAAVKPTGWFWLFNTRFFEMRWKTGRLFKIKLSNGGAAFALALEFPELAFFNCFNPDANIQEILKSDVLWRLWVMKHVLEEPGWQPIAVVTDMPKNLLRATPRFKKDIISGQYTIYIDGVESPATKEQCIGLESAAVWSALHLQDRLQDHIAGIPNRWVVSLLP